MTWLLVALAFLLLNKNNSPFSSLGLGNLGDIFSSFGGTSNEKGNKDKSGIIFELLSNPMVLEMLKNLIFKKDENTQEGFDQQTNSTEDVDDQRDKKSDIDGQENAGQEKTQENKQTSQEYEVKENKCEKNEYTKDCEGDNDTKKGGNTYEEAEEFFAPIDKIASNEVKKELYALYDNWYICKRE